MILDFNTFIHLLSIQVWFQLPSAINAVILIITVIINGSPLLRPIGKPPSFSVTRLEAARSALLTTPPTSQPRQPVDKSFHNFPQNKHNYHNNHLLYMLHNRTYRHQLIILWSLFISRIHLMFFTALLLGLHKQAILIFPNFRPFLDSIHLNFAIFKFSKSVLCWVLHDALQQFEIYRMSEFGQLSTACKHLSAVLLLSKYYIFKFIINLNKYNQLMRRFFL